MVSYKNAPTSAIEELFFFVTNVMEQNFAYNTISQMPSLWKKMEHVCGITTVAMMVDKQKLKLSVEKHIKT
jgi:hypothetical protein